MMFGKQHARFDDTAIRLRDVIASALPSGYRPPAYVSYTWGIQDWGMMINGPDPNMPSIPAGLGDCTIAACGHAEQVWTHGKTTISDSVILSAYEKWAGYVLGDPTTDRGAVVIDVLNDWTNQTLGGHVLQAFAQPQPQNLSHVMTTIDLFGGIYMGLQVPNSAVTQNAKGQIWDVVTDDGGIAGGHAVFCPAYHTLDPTAGRATTITCITWGGLQKMTLAFWDKYCDESYALLASAWQPRHVDVTQLRNYLQNVAN